MFVNDYEKLEYIVNTFFPKKEIDILKLTYFDSYTVTCSAKILNMDRVMLWRNKQRLVEKLRDYFILTELYYSVINDKEFNSKTNLTQIKILYYLMCLRNKIDISKIMKHPYNKIFKERQQLYELLKQYKPEFYKKFMEVRKKYRCRYVDESS